MRVEADDSILEVATDKVDTEVPAPFSGTLMEMLVEEGQVVKIGSPVARMQVEDSVKAGKNARATSCSKRTGISIEYR